MVDNSSPGSYVGHLAIETGAVGAAAARSDALPASHAPETTVVVWSNHSLRV
jgi:hypothetical protein